MPVTNVDIAGRGNGGGLCHRRKQIGNGRRPSGNRRRFTVKFALANQRHRSQAEDLSGAKHGLLNGRAVDESAVGGAQVLHRDDTVLQFNLAMMAGNGIVDDLKIIVLDPSQTVQSRFEQDFLQAVRTSFNSQSHHKSSGLIYPIVGLRFQREV